MNFKSSTTIAVFACIAGAATANADIIFSDDFESGLGQWTGKNGGAHQGILVNDPLDNSNTALSFSGLASAGDLFTADPILLDPNQSYRISFDYLGLAQAKSRLDDTGGYVGFSVDMPGLHKWKWATGNVSGASDVLIDDGQWNSYQYDFTAADLGIGNSVRLMLEDFVGSAGRPGDAFFDNFQISTVPTPGAIALLGMGGLIATRRRR